MSIDIAPLADADRGWAAALLAERWGSAQVVTRGRVHQGDRLPGFVARAGGRLAGLLTYAVAGGELEVVSLDSLEPGAGVGTALLARAREEAVALGCRRLWLITTNDNTPALRFYQRRGLTIAAVHVGAIAQSRRLKPSIPLTGMDGIPIRDEIELEVLTL